MDFHQALFCEDKTQYDVIINEIWGFCYLETAVWSGQVPVEVLSTDWWAVVFVINPCSSFEMFTFSSSVLKSCGDTCLNEIRYRSSHVHLLWRQQVPRPLCFSWMLWHQQVQMLQLRLLCLWWETNLTCCRAFS